MKKPIGQLLDADLISQRGSAPDSTYSFKHALIQDTAYQSMLRTTRQQVHQKIAQVLESQFAETVETQRELVAHHYTEAELYEQAVMNWQRAGENAIQRSAHAEASHHLLKALASLRRLPDTAERSQQEIVLQRALGTAFMATKGYASPEVEGALTRAQELCEQIGDTSRLSRVLGGLGVFYLVRGTLQSAYQVGDNLLTLSQQQQDWLSMQQAYLLQGQALFHIGELEPAQRSLDEGIALSNAKPDRPATFRGPPPYLGCYSYGSWTLWWRGYPDQALKRTREGLMLARDLSHPHSLAWTLTCAALLHQCRREGQMAQERAEEAIRVSTEQDFPFWASGGMLFKGWALAEQGQGKEGVAILRQGIAAWRASGSELQVSHWLALLAEAYGKAEEVDEGLVILDEALLIATKNGEHNYESELYRLRGELMLAQSWSGCADAETDFHRALEISNRQQAKSWELRAATSLARLWQSQGKRQDAYDLLAPVYGWFTEGFDTSDLIEAKGLLDELAN